MEGLLDTMTLSLRPHSSQDAKPESLQSVISRINNQRDDFRNITEASLEKEISEQRDGGEPPQEGLNNGQKDDQDKKNPVQAARPQIEAAIARAFQDSFMALDFISLLLSQSTPRQAEVSMSPHVKERIPLGSLGAIKVAEPYVSPNEAARVPLIAEGWKVQSLQSSAESLLHAAESLTEEVSLESRYWSDLLKIREEGWALSRLPIPGGANRGINAPLAVHFGFPDAAPAFRDRGIAPLRRSQDDGSAVLGEAANVPRAICVRLLHPTSRAVLGQSDVPALIPSNASVDQHVRQARDVLFAEELYHEIAREARGLAHWGCKIRDDEVDILCLPQFTVSVLLMSLEEHAQQSSSTASSSSYETMLANATVLALNLFLTHEHARTLAQRSIPPPPLSDQPQERKAYELLRPIIVHLQHFTTLNALKARFRAKEACMAPAGLAFKISTSRATTHMVPPQQQQEITTTAKKPVNAQALLDKLCAPLLTSLELDLPDGSKAEVTVKTSSIWGGESFGVTLTPHSSSTTTTTTTTTQEQQSQAQNLAPQHFATPDLLYAYMTFLTTKAITSHIITSSVSSTPAGGETWQATSSPSETTLYLPLSMQTKRLRVLVGERTWGVEWGIIGGGGGGGGKGGRVRKVMWLPPTAPSTKDAKKHTPQLAEVLSLASKEDDSSPPIQSWTQVLAS